MEEARKNLNTRKGFGIATEVKVTSHFGICGHQGVKATPGMIIENFWWALVKICFHCLVSINA